MNLRGLAVVSTVVLGFFVDTAWCGAEMSPQDDPSMQEMIRRLNQSQDEFKRQQRQMRATQRQLSRIPDIDNQRLSETSLALWAGTVKLRPLAPATISAGPADVQSAPVDAMAQTTRSLAIGAASSQLGAAYSLARLGFDLHDIYLVGSGQATPSHLKHIVPHVALACERMGMSMDPRDPAAAMMMTTPLPHREPGLEHRVVDSWARINIQHDRLTDTLITTTHRHITTHFEMNGAILNTYLTRLESNNHISIPQTPVVSSVAFSNLLNQYTRQTQQVQFRPQLQQPRIDIQPPPRIHIPPPPRIDIPRPSRIYIPPPPPPPPWR